MKGEKKGEKKMSSDMSSPPTSTSNGASSSSSSSLPPLYSVLGVPVNVSQAELSRHFKRLSLQMHPDRVAYRNEHCQDGGKSNNNNNNNNNNSVVMSEAEVQRRYQRITEAYGILSDPRRRAAYDTRHGVNFQSRVAALREAMNRHEVAAAPTAKRHCSEEGRDAEKESTGGGVMDKEEEEEEEYTPC